MKEQKQFCAYCGKAINHQNFTETDTGNHTTLYYCSSDCKKKNFKKKQLIHGRRVRKGYAILEAMEFMLKDEPFVRFTKLCPVLYTTFNAFGYCPSDYPPIPVCLNCPYPKCFREYFDSFSTE